MKKIISIVTLLTLGATTVSYASIDKNLKYGQRDKEVTELQEFLIDKGLLKTTPSTYFGLLTFKAVKAYQTSIGVSPTGFVGMLTREKINKEIDAEVASSNEAERAEVTTSSSNIQQTNTKPVVATQVFNDICKNIEGVQTTVPLGMLGNSDGNCLTQQSNINATPQTNTNIIPTFQPLKEIKMSGVPEGIVVFYDESPSMVSVFPLFLINREGSGRNYIYDIKGTDGTDFTFQRGNVNILPKEGTYTYTVSSKEFGAPDITFSLTFKKKTLIEPTVTFLPESKDGSNILLLKSNAGAFSLKDVEFIFIKDSTNLPYSEIKGSAIINGNASSIIDGKAILYGIFLGVDDGSEKLVSALLNVDAKESYHIKVSKVSYVFNTKIKTVVP